MNRLNPVAPLIFIAFVITTYINCVNNMAGGTEDVNTKVVGTLFDTANVPASDTWVRLLPADFNPLTDTLEKVAVSGITDDTGKYLLMVPYTEKAYTLEALHTKNGKRLLKSGIFLETTSDTTIIPTDTLRTPGTITVEFTDSTFSGSGYLYIPGTSFSVFADSLNGRAVLDSVPTENIYTLCFASTATSPADTIRNEVYVPTGSTVQINNPGWSYRAQIRINTSATGVQITNNLTDFPLLVSLNSGNFDFTQCNTSGSDLRFLKNDTTPFAYEIEQWNVGNNGNGSAKIWVLIDTIHANDSLQSFNLYWGKKDAASASNGNSVFDTENGFEGVWHLNENPSNGGAPIKDRTTNGYHGTPIGSMTSESVVPGVIGDALRYDGINDNISAGQLNLSRNYTLSCWVNFDDLDTARRCIWKQYSYTLWYHSAVNGVRIEHFTQRPESNILRWSGFYQDGGTERSIDSESWFFLTGTYNGNRIHLYINGELQDSTDVITAPPIWSDTQLLLGGRTGELVKGTMDEVRVESRTRSPEWIHLCFENQRGNSALLRIEK